jgi:hypothetical protein
MTHPNPLFEASFLEAIKQFPPVFPPDCSIRGRQTAVADEDVDQDVATIHDEIG